MKKQIYLLWILAIGLVFFVSSCEVLNDPDDPEVHVAEEEPPGVPCLQFWTDELGKSWITLSNGGSSYVRGVGGWGEPDTLMETIGGWPRPFLLGIKMQSVWDGGIPGPGPSFPQTGHLRIIENGQVVCAWHDFVVPTNVAGTSRACQL